MRNLKALLYVLIFVIAWEAKSQELITLEDALLRTLETHPNIASGKLNFEAEEASISSKQWPSDPMFGVMYEQNMNLMQQQMGAMTSLSFSQSVDFPAKYYFRGKIQNSAALYAKEEIDQEKLSLRKRLITTYYKLYVNQQNQDLVEAQKATLQQVARSAESRRSTGQTTQQDEMKAHLEQTLIANELFSIKQEERALQGNLSALLTQEPGTQFALSKSELPIPNVHIPENIFDLVQAGSVQLKKDRIKLEEKSFQKELAIYDFAPDFRFSARTMVGNNRPDNNFAVSVDVSLPLWFFTKQSPELRAASAKINHAQTQIEGSKRELFSKANETAAMIKDYDRLLKVFKTTLIPQANSTFSASSSAYQAGTASFLELLDSARTLYTVRVTYYRNIAMFVEQITLLEELVGTSISSLPFGVKS